jgi:dTDP-4-dehydrorhamnose reductase
VPDIVPIRASDYPTPAIRPADTRLDCSRIARDYRVAPRRGVKLEETVNSLAGEVHLRKAFPPAVRARGSIR